MCTVPVLSVERSTNNRNITASSNISNIANDEPITEPDAVVSIFKNCFQSTSRDIIYTIVDTDLICRVQSNPNTISLIAFAINETAACKIDGPGELTVSLLRNINYRYWIS